MKRDTDNEIDRLHNTLHALYRGRSTDKLRIEGLWARIERLEKVAVKLEAREGRLENV